MVSVSAAARLSFVTALSLGFGCNRTPPEPQPVATASAASALQKSDPDGRAGASAPSANPARCIKPLADVAPKTPAIAKPPACPPDPEGPQKLPIAHVAFPETPAVGKVEVEIAKTEHDVQRGLMYRMEMPEDHGMFFKLEDRREHTFWMHNTCLPLDIMFVDDDGTIVGISESAQPLTDTTRTVGCASSYVLEMNAGWARRHGVKPGQRMGIPAAAK